MLYLKVKDIDFLSAKKLKKWPQSNFQEQRKSIAEKGDQTLPIASPSEGNAGCIAKLKCPQNWSCCSPLHQSLCWSLYQWKPPLQNIPDLLEWEMLSWLPRTTKKMCWSDNGYFWWSHNRVELTSRDQASGSGFIRHSAGKISVSESHAAFHTNVETWMSRSVAC